MSNSDDSNRDADELWTNETILRARVFLIDRRKLAVVVAVCLLCLGGWMMYAGYAASSEPTEQRTTEIWSMTGTVSHGATIAEPTTVYGDDDNAEVTDQPVYYRSISPTANGKVAVEYDAEQASDVELVIDLEVVTRAVDGGTVYWDVSEPLNRTERDDVEPGNTVAATFELNVSRIEERIDAIEEELDASPGDTETYVDATISLDGTIEGEQISTTRQQRIDLSVDESTYSFDDNGSFTEKETDTETVTTTESKRPIYTAGGPLLFMLGVVGCGVTLWTIRRPPSEIQHRWIDYRNAREEFDAVIVRANLPLVEDRVIIEVLSLEELATLAIDVNSTVLEEQDDNRYTVYHQHCTYVYEPPQEPWNQSNSDSDAVSNSETDTMLVEWDQHESDTDTMDEP
ncbi:DUF5305 domain-containing protein [Natronolimnohabitans innermongolicus]|uniref:DUF5305 domain-containing protein n=1 Tax=Natronolimnohabitans innermongolicus JCM 12255 TaxID=1227499 RepID=L9WP99_9EURY|nr:DUF5305 domain-containing protein [Natronolimnohabitans innermongolicus]ELY51011.1 hypothetical protein C493_18546 [Natronolimnohabitans innermongolicus JCM 12255]